MKKILSLSVLFLALSFPLLSLSLHVRPADFPALQPPHGLPQALVDRAHGVDDRDGFAFFGPVRLRAVLARQPAPEGPRHAQVDAGADVEVEDVARVGVGLFCVFVVVVVVICLEGNKSFSSFREEKEKESFSSSF